MKRRNAQGHFSDLPKAEDAKTRYEVLVVVAHLRAGWAAVVAALRGSPLQHPACKATYVVNLDRALSRIEVKP